MAKEEACPSCGGELCGCGGCKACGTCTCGG